MTLSERLQELLNIPLFSWERDDFVPPSPPAVAEIQRLMGVLEGMPTKTYLYPTPEGGFQLAWDYPDNTSVEVYLSPTGAEWTAIDRKGESAGPCSSFAELWGSL